METAGRIRFTCPRCLLSITLRAAQPEVEVCPRCMARRHAVQLVRTPQTEPDPVPEGGVSAGALRLRVEDAGDAVAVRLVGPLDLATAPVVARAVEHAATGDRAILVDLSGVHFMDSSGFRCLLRLRRSLGDRLALRPPPESVQQVFRQMGLLDLLELDG
jgi:anti-anti-sigma factor